MARDPLWNRVPEIWRRLDTDGVLDGFLATIDSEYDRLDAKVFELFDLRNVDRVPDRYLMLLSPLVGHEWRTDKGRLWNRRRIRDAIRRWSYKGTYANLSDLMAEYGGGSWSVLDMASQLLVWNAQGEWSGPSSCFLDANLYHPGAFVLTLPVEIDIEDFIPDHERIKPAGEVWYYRRCDPSNVVIEEVPNPMLVVNVWCPDYPPNLWDDDMGWNDAAASNQVEIEATIGLNSVMGGTIFMNSDMTLDRTDVDIGPDPMDPEVAVKQNLAEIYTVAV